MEMKPHSNLDKKALAVDFGEMWGRYHVQGAIALTVVLSCFWGNGRYSFIATHARFESTRSFSPISSLASSSSSMSLSSTSSTRSRSSLFRLSELNKKDSAEVTRFVKIVCLILECPMDKALLQLCILGEVYGGFSVFLDAFVASLKTVLICKQIEFSEERVEQFLFFVGDMVELLRDDVTLRSGMKDSDFSEDQMECSESNEADLDLFYDFWREKIVDSDLEGRLSRRVSSMLLESSSQLKNLFPTRTDLQKKIVDHLVTVFSDSVSTVWIFCV
eukprot:TRINITY_DN4689_c0_g1_i3.p1 TRINITY_DN4689_c0_g1~~TRINITY_DN4689_c0_g1_i3.p1  ORF type:complete len:275 (+),score=40.24 TRINITY_DN4689_c0_g1_i3:3-827(+)